MNIDQPLCNLKTCRLNFDGNCTNESYFEKCEYAWAIGELARLSPLAETWEQRARKMFYIDHHPMDTHCFYCKNPMKSLDTTIVGCDGNCQIDDFPNTVAAFFAWLDTLGEVDVKECL